VLHIVVIAHHFGFCHHLQIFSENKRNIFSVEAILATNFCILPSVHSYCSGWLLPSLSNTRYTSQMIYVFDKKINEAIFYYIMGTSFSLEGDDEKYVKLRRINI